MRATLSMLVLLSACGAPAGVADVTAVAPSPGVPVASGEDDVALDDVLDLSGDADPTGTAARVGAPPPPHDPTPACGEVLTHSIHLHDDIGPCGALGLEIGADDIVLDCDGHHIRGSGGGVGILLQGRAGVIVRDCHVEDFDDGLRMRDTIGNRITDNHFTRGDVEGSTGDLIAGNTFRGRLDLRGTRALTVADNTLNEDVAFGLALLAGDDDFGLRVHGNDVRGGLELIDSHAVRVDGNHIEDYGLLVESAHGNRIDRNRMERDGILILDSNDNLFLRNDIVAPEDDGFALFGASGSSRNLFRDNEVHDAGDDGFRLSGSGHGNTRDNVLEHNEACGSGVADLWIDAGDVFGTVLVDNDFCVVSGI